MAYSHLPYPSNPSLQAIKVLAADSVIYLSPTGNDTTGDGSLATPYQTLSKAMDVARTYTIVGGAVLYIRFLRGEYTLSGTVDLYHPQGSNIIIEGDPSAFQQRTLFQVESYTWNLQNFAGGGHTGTIRLFDGVTTNASGATMHGFTGRDQGMYFTITNAAIGSRDGYISGSASKSGVSSVASGDGSYSHLFYGDRFFNHGYSYEEGEGILGIGRVLAATADTAVLTVQFQNTNIDTRCPVHNLTSGGLANTNTWAGVASNYPENQYSQPVGYYGFSSWAHDTQSISFPTKASTSSSAGSYITTDPYLMSTYPVVLRGDYGSNKGTLLLKNGTLRAIRNIFFANSAAPYTLVSGVTGATLNYSQALTAMCDQNLRHGGNGTALSVENATIGIRHLGFYGVGTALSANGSKVYAYYDNTGYTGSAAIASQNGQVTYATQNTLDNSPVLCTTQCKHGIVSKNSTIDLSNSSGLNRNNGVDYRHNGSYISTTARSVELFGSKLYANSLHINSDSDVPKFYAKIAVPIFGGMTTASGGSACFTAFEDNTLGNYWSTFPTAKMFITEVGTATAREIGYINYVTDGGSVPGTDLIGATAGAGLSSAGSAAATDFRYYNVYGWRLSNDSTAVTESLKYMTKADVQLGITANNGGGSTFSMVFYRDAAATGVSAEYVVSKNTVLVSGFNGVRQGYTNMSNSSGLCAAPQFLNLFQSGGGNCLPYVYMNNTANALSVYNGSTVMVEKALIITNGGFLAVDVRENSDLNIGDLNTSVLQSNANSANVPTTGLYSNFSGALCVRNYGLIALSLIDNCRATIGSVFAKHPLYGNPSENNNITVESIETVRANNYSTVKLGGVYSVGIPGNTTLATATPLFTSRMGNLYGTHNGTTESFVNAKNGGKIMVWMVGDPEGVFAFDGGTADFKIGATSKYNITKALGDGTVHLLSALQTATTTSWSDSTVKTRVVHDTRATPTILTRSSNFLYNRTTGNRAWKGAFPTSPGFTTSGVNIGNADGSQPASAAGLTYTSYVSNYGKTIQGNN
jgi:hypothetical protein